MKLKRSELRKIILREMQNSIGEEALMQKDDYPGYGMLHRHDDPGRQAMYQACRECGSKMSVYEGEKGVCEQCGSSMMYEGKSGMCEQCGTKSMVYEGEKGVCEQCGYSTMEAETQKEYMNEGACGGCGSCGPCGEDDGTDYSIDTMGMIGDALGALTNAGYDVDAHKVGNHKTYKGSYMAKSHLYKVNKYSEKLYHMRPDGHNLEDWMRTKLAQIADDIGEVYHALDHDIFEGDV